MNKEFVEGLLGGKVQQLYRIIDSSGIRIWAHGVDNYLYYVHWSCPNDIDSYMVGRIQSGLRMLWDEGNPYVGTLCVEGVRVAVGSSIVDKVEATDVAIGAVGADTLLFPVRQEDARLLVEMGFDLEIRPSVVSDKSLFLALLGDEDDSDFVEGEVEDDTEEEVG